MNISVCLITLNEGASLGRALHSVEGIADEIVVLDSGSTDDTGEVARRFGARFLHQDWLGYVGQKNAVRQLATHPWVLSLDGDEELSPALREEIAARRRQPVDPKVAGFSMPRCVLYEGRWIRHGDWYPDRLVRLFRRDRARFEGGKVHERLVVEGRIEPLRGDIHHYSFRDAADHRARGEKYARLWAESALESGRRCWPLGPELHAAHRWWRGYVLRGGFLDGRQGWQIAAVSAREVWLKYRLLRQLQGRARA